MPIPHLALAFLAAPLALQSTPALQAAETLRAPFTAEAAGPGLLALTLAPDAYATLAGRHATGTGFVLERWPLPEGRTTRAHLRPVGAFEPGARARVVEADGSESWLAPSVVCFSGWLDDGSELFFGLTRESLHGYFRLEGELHFLSSGGLAAGQALLARASALPDGPGDAWACATPAPGPRERADGDTGGERELMVTPRLRTASVFIEADPAFRGLFPSNQACLDYSALLVAATSEVYRRDLGVRLTIPNGYLRVWNSTPPWGVITTFNHIANVRDWWVSFANPDRSLPRAAVHVFTAPVFGGVANSIGGVCINGNGYEISSLYGTFPSPRVHTSSQNWDLFVVAHEFGHSFGCMHSFDFQPPIQCQDGSGPDSGTIMSYCHLNFGVGGVGMRFHVREQNVIRQHVTFVGCMLDQPLVPGDYDGDGALDLDDLVALDAVLVQGFRSVAAEEVLDLDGDGRVDVDDRTLLAAAIGTPPASATFRNGRGLNNECLFVSGNPVLGRRWTPSVVAGAAGRPTSLFFFDLPHPGIRTAYGELLVLPPSLGGRQLFATTRISSGVVVEFPLNLPADVALIGVPATLQGLVSGSQGTELCNAFDVVFSTYE